MINLSSLINIGVDEKSILLATADKMEEALNETRNIINNIVDLIDSKYYTIGNHAILGSLLKKILSNDADALTTTFESLNVQTNLVDVISFDQVTEELSESIQSGEILITAVRSAAESGLQNISDYLQVLMTRLNTTIGALTVQSKTIVNNIVSYVSACNGEISKGLSQFISTIRPKLSDGVITYDAANYLGINPFISGFAFMDGVEIISNVISVTLSVAGTVFFGAVGMLLGSIWNTAYNFIKYAVTSMQDPVDVYCRNEFARPCFDYSGTDITVEAEELPIGHWARLMEVGDHYCFYFPGFELHLLRTQEPKDLITVRVIPLMLSTPGGFAISRDEVFGTIKTAMDNGRGIEASVQAGASVGTTSIIKPNQDSDETNLWSWVSGSKSDTYALSLIFKYTSDNTVLQYDLTGMNDLICLLSLDRGTSDHYFLDSSGGNVLFLGRSVLSVDPGHSYTNAEWFETLYKRHQKNTPTYSQAGESTLTKDEVINCFKGYANQHVPSSLADVYDRSTHTNELRAVLLMCNLAGLCYANLTPARKYTGNDTIIRFQSFGESAPWYSNEWLYRKFYSEERGAYAIYTDTQNAQRVGKIYTGLVIAAAGLTVAITAGVIKGNIKKKAFSEQRKLDNMCFDTTKSDKECRAQNIKTKFWSALAGSAVSTEDAQLVGTYFNNIIADAEGSRFVNDCTRSESRSLDASIATNTHGAGQETSQSVASDIEQAKLELIEEIEGVKNLIH